MSAVRPIKLIVAALGGQGGGVVCDWLVHVAHLEGYLIQTTSVPGVAQRTGATIYYLEFFPRSALPADGRRPVLALLPHAGDVDVVLSSEIMEAGRALQRGIVTRDKTTLITSSHRVYAIGEKTHLADGRADSTRVMELARAHSKRFVCLDMQAVAEAHGSVISAAMLGALAASGALPFKRKSFEEAIRAGGIAVQQSLAAFEAAALAAGNSGALPVLQQAELPSRRSGPLPSALTARLEKVPASIRSTVEEGARRLIDYQDVEYANLYLSRLEPVLRFEGAAGGASKLPEAVARGLALWMSFEDTIRVADLKIRTARARRVLEEVRARPDQVVYVTEYMKPRVEEICGTLPAPVGRGILGSRFLRGLLGRLTNGRQVSTSRVSGFVMLYLLAGMRRWRRGTLRYREEDTRIASWLAMLNEIAARDPELAVEVAECQQLVKGYGDTHERGTRNFDLIMKNVRAWEGRDGAAAHVRALRTAAVADEEGTALARVMALAPDS